MKTVVFLLDGQSFILEVESTDTIDHIKEKINSIIHIPSDQLRIIYSGYQLEDGRTVADYRVKEGSKLHVCFRLRGGGSGEEERPRGRKKDKVYVYNIYYGDHALQLGWRDEHDKELLHLLLKDGTISGGNIQEAEWLNIKNRLNNSQNCLNNSQNRKFEIDFLKERLREYNQWYSLLVDETSSSIFHWDLANEFIHVKPDGQQDYEMRLSGAQLLYLKCLQKLVRPDISWPSNYRTRPPSTMKIVLSLHNGQSFILESKSTDTIDHIKAKVYSITDITTDAQGVNYFGCLLDDGNMSLASLNVREGSMLVVNHRIRGDGPGGSWGEQEDVHECYNIYNIYYGDHALQSGWRDEHNKELLQLLPKDGKISGGNITDKAWLRIQNCLNNSQNCNFEIDFLKDRLREYNQWYSLLVDETSSSIFHWDLANKFIHVKPDGQGDFEFEMSLSEAQLSYLKCLQMLFHQDISLLSKIRAKFRKFRKCLTRSLTCSKTG